MTKRPLLLTLGLTMAVATSYGQSLLSARSLALGAYGASVTDTRSFESNPAGIVGLRDWEFSTTTYGTTGSGGGFVFQGLTLGKRILDDAALSIAYMPGSLLEFALPAIVITSDSGTPASIQQRVSYHENLLVAGAYRLFPTLSVGIAGRFRRTTVSDTKYELIPQGSGYVPRITPRTEEAATTLLDAGVLFRPVSSLRLGLVARNLLTFRQNLPSDLSVFELPEEIAGELSTRIEPMPSLALMAQASTRASGAVGVEFTPLDVLALRGGLYFDRKESPAFYGWTVGAGWRYEFLELDAGYVGFPGGGSHSGRIPLASFDASRLHQLDLQPYTVNRAVVTVKAMFGKIRSPYVRILSAELLSGIYPSSYELFAFRPIGQARVKNISDRPVQARARFFIEGFMDAPTETPPVALQPGEERVIPFTAVLNRQVREVTQLVVREAEVYVSATASDEYDDRLQTSVLIHGRNDWDGDVMSLRHFVTPDDPDILRYTREVLVEYKDSLASVPLPLQAVAKARLLFNTFAGKLVYVGDPKVSTDFVQYPSETLRLRSGDCDDMTVCFASLLGSIGISAAFVDVVPPSAPEKSHIYLMFDTGLEPRFGHVLSENPKRFVVRRNARGEETLWLPIETTVITQGFERAWELGAQEYFDDVEVNLGLIKGWVRIVDVH